MKMGAANVRPTVYKKCASFQWLVYSAEKVGRKLDLGGKGERRHVAQAEKPKDSGVAFNASGTSD